MTEVEMEQSPRERLRIQALNDLGLLDSLPEDYYDSLTRIASHLTEAPVCLISLVDRDRQFFKSSFGLEGRHEGLRETPLSHSFCKHVVDSGETMVVTDASIDERVRGNGAIKDLGVLAYLGAPLVDAAGNTLGAFCAIENAPREWTAEQVQVMEDLANLIGKSFVAAEEKRRAEATEQRLKQQNQLTRDFLTILAHDLKNPLSGISLAAQMLQEQVPDKSPEVEMILSSLFQSVDRMKSHIDHVLEKGAAEAGPEKPELSFVDLERIVLLAVKSQQAQLQRRSIRVEIEPRNEGTVVAGDEEVLGHILQNLLSNSIKFAPRDSLITIQLHDDGFTLSDEGPGFTESDLEQLFQSYVRLSAVSDDGSSSTGLGLSICKKLADSIRGDICCLSGPGEPARFRVTLQKEI